MTFSNKRLLDDLRKEAEKALKETDGTPQVRLSEKQIKELLNELQIQQIELEMQNEELKIANEEAEGQHVKFLGLYDLAPVGYFILDEFAIIEEVNSTGFKLLDTQKRTVLNSRFQSFIFNEDTELFYDFLQKLRKTQTRHSLQITMITPKGRSFYAQVEGAAIFNNKLNKFQCYLAVIDITERKNAELKQQVVTERLEMALSASTTGTWEIDLSTQNIFLDNFSCKIFGLPQKEYNGKPDQFLKHIYKGDRKKMTDFFRTVSRFSDMDIEFRILFEGDTIRHIGARGHIVRDHRDYTRFIGILTDTTEKKQQEEEARSINENKEKEILAATLLAQENERHRISEMLHDSVSQLLYGIKLKLDHNSEPGDDFKYLIKSIHQLLDQAIKETRNMSFELAPSILKDFGLATTLDEMAKRLRTKNLMIKVSVLNNKLKLNVEVNVFRIIQELTNNAIKHSGATLINIEVSQELKSLLICVMDNGMGFDKKNISTRGGTGLASIKNRLSLFNGFIKIVSSPGKGSNILIVLKDIFN